MPVLFSFFCAIQSPELLGKKIWLGHWNLPGKATVHLSPMGTLKVALFSLHFVYKTIEAPCQDLGWGHGSVATVLATEG